MKALISVAFLIVSAARGFAPICPLSLSSRQPISAGAIYSTSDSSDHSDAEEEMTDLIVSLSLEPTDHDRRMRLKDVFHDALARPNGMPKQFTDLFDLVLTKVGDDVQTEAKKKYFEAQVDTQEETEVSSTSTESNDNTENDLSEEIVEAEAPPKSPEELQLWALVDMMVQSKTIVKKKSGDLGSKGILQ